MRSIGNRILKKVIEQGTFNLLPDTLYLKLLYKCYMGKRLNIEKPRTYNEKLQWLKIHDRKDIYTKMVDKYDAKSFAASIIGADYIIPTLGVWETPKEIDFDLLPTRFVLKTTHDSGGIKIIDKTKGLNKEEIIRYFEKRMRRSLYGITREWPYKNVKPRIIAEQFMEDEKTGELRDYKFFCFDGKVRALFIATDRQSKKPTAFDFFDEDFRWLDIRHGHPNAEVRPQRPENFELMKELAEKLSMGLCQLRVDLYEINGKVFFGELTFFHHGGIVPFDPEEWDYIFGDWIKLPFNERKE